MPGILDVVFPKRCVSCKKVGSYLCENCFAFLSFDAKSLCLICQRPIPDGMTHKACLKRYSIDGCFSAVPYNKTAKKLIYNFKYSPYVSDLRKIIGDLLYEYLLQNEAFQRLIQKGEWVFVAIPLHPEKFRKRGYNQARILCDDLSKVFKIGVLDALKRAKKTNSQFGLSLSQRKKNIRGAFSLSAKVKGFNIFLVDDIATTGSTLIEGASILKRGGAGKIIGITFARD